jgi:hypothetical protein
MVVKRQLRIKNLKQYHDHIIQCPAILQTLEIQYDTITQRILYHQTGGTDPADGLAVQLPTATTAPNNIPTHSILEEYEQLHMALRSNEHLETRPEAVVSRVQSPPASPTMTPAPQMPQPGTIDDVISDLILDIEEEDYAEPGHRYRNRFIHRFLDNYNAKMGDFGNYIKSTQQQLNKRVEVVENTMTFFDTQLANFGTVYQKAVDNAHKQVQEMDAKVSYFNTRMDQRVDTALSRVSQQVTHYQLQLVKWTKEQYERFQNEIQVDLATAVQVSIDSHLAPLFDQQTEALEQHGESLLTAIEAQAADCDNQKENRIKLFWSDVASATNTTKNYTVDKHVATRWKNATMPQTNETPPTPNTQHHTPRNRWGQENAAGNAKTTGEEDLVEESQRNAAPFQHFIPRKVPSQPLLQTEKQNIYVPLYHYEFVKRAQVKYTGQSHVFYNKLQNIGQQYGVYLKALNQLKCGLSLCPDEYAGHYFDTEEYRLMAAALYEKLADTSCISEDYPTIRHIIDGYTEDNDGYQIMYEIMEEHHPALQSDPVYHAPTSLECDNKLQEYTAHFQTYMTSQALNHHYYQLKGQVLHYLAGLDEEFSPAVTHLQMLLDSWGTSNGLPPKCDLHVLPKTIDDYMKKHTNQVTPFIQSAVAHTQEMPLVQPMDEIAKILSKHMDETTSIVRSLQNNPSKLTANKSLTDKRQSVDIFCDACGGHGHKAKNCDFTAQLVKGLDFIATLDAAKKKDIMETFLKEQTRRKLVKITVGKGRARVLRDTGDAEGLYKLLTKLDTNEDSDSQQRVLTASRAAQESRRAARPSPKLDSYRCHLNGL